LLYSQLIPSILAIEAIFPAPNACAGRARSRKMAIVSTVVEVLKDGILLVRRCGEAAKVKEGKLFLKSNVSGVKWSVSNIAMPRVQGA
jgi:hypothetical protein